MLIRFRFNDVVYKSINIFFSLLLIFSVPATLIANKGSNDYFPHTPGSFWVYEESGRKQANTPCRREKKRLRGETYHVFSYEPALEDWTDYEHYVTSQFLPNP